MIFNYEYKSKTYYYCYLFFLIRIQQQFNSAQMELYSFRCLQYDPAERMTPEEALSHPFLAPLCPFKYIENPKTRDPRGSRCSNYKPQMDEIMGTSSAPKSRKEEVFQRIHNSKQVYVTQF